MEGGIGIFIEVEGDLDGEDALEEELNINMEILVVGISMDFRFVLLRF